VLAESARAASAAEARYRIQAPNSRGRATLIVALDRPSEPVLLRLAQGAWHAAAFFQAPVADRADGLPADGWLTDLEGGRRRVRELIEAADQVIMLAGAGGNADAAALIGRASSDRRVTTTGLIIGAEHASDRDLSRTLAQLRPWSLMVVIAGSDDYLTDMMTALRV
jgi:hypothetical protein